MPAEKTSLRWRILALLFLVRMTMAIQFQMVAALSPAIEEAFAVTLADIGVLIGLYFAPGVIIAAPGGAMGRRFGEKETVLAGLALMVMGGMLMVLSDHWNAQLAGRIMSGVGGVILNVLLTKMVADWFVGQEISFAMAIFVNSWPVGIALALIGLPVIAVSLGLTSAMFVVVALISGAFVGLAILYQPPGGFVTTGVQPSARVRGPVLGAVLVAGGIWGLYNAALVIVFSFGPQLFFSRGMEMANAGSMTSLILWCLAGVGTISGFLADKSGRRLLFIGMGNLGFGFFIYLASISGNSFLGVIAIGLFSGVAVGAMVSLPSLVLPAAARSLGMGLFLTVYYVCIALGPMVAGALSTWISLAATFQLAAFLSVCSVCLLPLYQRFAQTAQEQSVGTDRAA